MRNLGRYNTLRSFVAVSDYGGVTRAASALNLTQSAVVDAVETAWKNCWASNY